MWNEDSHLNYNDESRRISIELALAGMARTDPYGYTGPSRSYQSDDEDSDRDDKVHHDQHSRQHDDDDDDDDSGEEMEHTPQPRGKPEAMAARLASASRLQEKYKELKDERDSEPVAQPLDETEADRKIEATAVAPKEAPPTSPKKKKKKPAAPKKSKATAPSTAFPTMDDPVSPISDVEYENLEQVMIQFCRVPLLAEFSRPVSLLHPELMGVYSKIVDHPIDLGKVCRKIRRRQYNNLRDVRLDTWRIFANCVKYHSHHSNKDAVPSFVSIALHLRDYFNDLWQEYMLPSDPPQQSGKSSKNSNDSQLRDAFAKRKEDRKRRNVVSGLSVMTGKCLERACASLMELIESGGKVDQLDKDAIFGDYAVEDDLDLDVVVDNLRKLHRRLSEITEVDEDYGIDELDRDVRRCYTEDVLENNPSLRMRVANRLDRWIGKIVVPIHEATCRGVSQSSIWGCMAAAVWARESSKKPYWPALVLGIMAPDDQREEWHNALTVRNEARLPEKLRSQLGGGKRKAEQALKKQSQGQMEPQSYFLVEFLGTHEFIWVKESDIQENFDPNDDPNQHAREPGSKKKRASRSSVANVLGSKMYASAVEEAKWALEEFELQLQDVGGDAEEEEEDSEEMNYSYSVLCQSDDEADDEVGDDDVENLDIDECNELLATNGLLDFTTEGRKNAKKRAQAMKRQKADAERKIKADKAKKQKAEMSKKKKDARAKERESKKEQRDLEKKRKKRARERDKAIKGTEQKNKKRKVSELDIKKSASGRRNLIAGKRERATAIVEGYLNRAIEREHYKTLCLGGVMTIPASLIDSSGIFGMALAFRAAAGELPMPEESGDQGSNMKPWEAIKVDEEKSSKKRCDLLEKQIALLEKEIKDRKKATEQRLKLAEEIREGCKDNINKLHESDALARLNPLKKKKPAPPSGKKGKKAKASANEEDGDKSQDAGTSRGEGAQSPSVASAEGSNAPDLEGESTGDWDNDAGAAEKTMESDDEGQD